MSESDLPNFAESSIDEVWRYRAEWKDSEDYAKERRRHADQELLRRAAAEDRQILDTSWGPVAITYSSSGGYLYDTIAVDRDLFPLIQRDGLEAEWNQFVRHSYKIDKRWLNRLGKRGPEYRDVVGRVTIAQQGTPTRTIAGPTLKAMGGYAPEPEGEIAIP